MNKIFNILFLVLFGLGVFFYREKLQSIYEQSFAYYFPCKTVITYDLGEFNTKFGISKNDFLKSLSDAEKIWESSIGRDLFKHEEWGRVKVNLIFDERQSTTQTLKGIGVVVENNKTSYDSLKLKYEELQREYKSLKITFDTKVSNFESRRDVYESEVSAVNRKGGANKTTYEKLNIEREYLNNELVSVKQMQTSLNNKVEEINALADALNNLAKTLNLSVDKYNTIGATLGGEFEEGTFISNNSGQFINIYQFDNRLKLVRVLAHELGHALGLDHNEDPKAIMYRLNNGINEKLTSTDIAELKELCRI